MKRYQVLVWRGREMFAIYLWGRSAETLKKSVANRFRGGLLADYWEVGSTKGANA